MIQTLRSAASGDEPDSAVSLPSTANNGAVRRALTSSVAISPELSVAQAVASQGEAIRSQLAVFLHDKHSRTEDPLGKHRDMPEPDSLGG